jgi:hypothetical protein
MRRTSGSGDTTRHPKIRPKRCSHAIAAGIKTVPLSVVAASIGDGIAGKTRQFSVRDFPQIAVSWRHHKNHITRHVGSQALVAAMRYASVVMLTAVIASPNWRRIACSSSGGLLDRASLEIGGGGKPQGVADSLRPWMISSRPSGGPMVRRNSSAQPQVMRSADEGNELLQNMCRSVSLRRLVSEGPAIATRPIPCPDSSLAGL